MASAAVAAPADATAVADIWRWGSGVIAIMGYALAAFTAASSARVSQGSLLLAWLAHGVSLALDVAGGGTGARFGFAPALSITTWIVVAAHAVEPRSTPMVAARRVVGIVSILAILLALQWPGEARAAESPWAPLHWLLGLVSYGLVGAAVVHAWLLDRAERRLRERRPTLVGADAAAGAVTAPAMPLLTLERLTFRFVDAGFVVLTAAIALGAWFAVRGSGWRWDHKSVFSLLGWVTLAALVAGRHGRGWRGRRATRWVYLGAFLLLLAYMGSRFVFEVVLGRAF